MKLYCYQQEEPSAQIEITSTSTELELNDLELKLIEPDPKVFTTGVQRIQKYIAEGDVYQVNLTRKYIVKPSRALDLRELRSLATKMHEQLKQSNPAPYSQLSETSDYIIVSSSPECFLKIERVIAPPPGLSTTNFKLTTMPIKGTASLSDEPSLRSSKNQAEHVMIVDVERNDLSRICKPNSVIVEKLMSAHKFNNLKHLVSTISGLLKDELIIDGKPDLDAVFRAMFPSGSITGAPKLRSMQIIEELEPCPRGPYTGVLGYYDDARGYGEWCILIRTIVINKRSGEISFHVGGGITALSNPLEELEETRLKAAKIIEAIGCKI